MSPNVIHSQPDYISVQGNFYVLSAGFAINLHDGSSYWQGSLGRTYPAYSLRPGASVMLGTINGGGTATSTSEFLTGAGAQGSAIFPVYGLLGVGAGINHSYGGATAVEIGIGTPGYSVSPAAYGTPR
jgi:filamentous hemagglutinin